MTVATLEELRRLKLFAELPAEQLEWLAAHGERLEYAAGARLYEEDDTADAMYIVLEGTIQTYFALGGQQILVTTTTPGGATGLLPFSRMTRYNVRGVAGAPLTVLRVGRERFGELTQVSPELAQRLVALMSDRVREATRMQQQREKMSALGTLSAGLAHELNNPAAAVMRAASALRERMTVLPALTSRLAAHALTPDQVCAADALREKGSPARAPTALERAEREEAVIEWLEAHAVEDAWKLAPAFIEAELGVPELDRLAGVLPDGALGDVLAWLAAGLDADRLLIEIEHASERISELVSSVKSYSHMDRAVERESTDVHAGLDNTLTMLGHKVRKKSARLERHYDPALPHIAAFGGDLNQVWTNLLDNALDAVSEGGQVQIATGRDGRDIWVRITNEGPEIPKEIRSRIFEPFFTTKGVGEGTGLGLDMVDRIVRFHQGQVTVDSGSGRTSFTVRLPIEAPARAVDAGTGDAGKEPA